MSDRLLPDLLDEIEKRELPLLSWGVVGGSFSEEELLEVLRSQRPDHDPEELLDRLLDQHMVVARGIAGDRFRSRMAETVRLAVQLRQWFPGKDWRTAPPLVSDVRFLSRARAVPRRDLSPDALVDGLSRDLGDGWSESHESTVRAILGSRDASAFQARATTRLLEMGVSGAGAGTCVTAGTGAGKTLAFYLPALAHILATPAATGVPRIVAIYPRTELLRDQLRGILITLRRLEDAGAGNLRVGVLYGATPHDRSNAQRSRERGWTHRSGGLLCPIVSCLNEDCDGSYEWPDSAGESELLVCATCGNELRSLSFTRQRLQSHPPEILFTTTEMVNRLLGSGRARRILAGDGKRSPDFVLLDEVHTYAGTHGAQVANLLRRWRSEMATPSHVVGLSATLADPVGFFSQLIGVNSANVSVVAPAEGELVEFGREYFMALRGDPASQTSLLSTTIQTSMLLRRMLDPEPGRPSGGAFGSRLFVFTDKLDLVNRLHTQLQDAEGWLPGGVNRKPGGSLALLREKGPEERARDDAGQLWDAAEDLGTLKRPMVVGRTTSKDSGVDSNTDVVVATASLEVGFDDPNVGAVLQHKAPRDAAQFLQRRGRAGRDPAMRPWTAVVLSDYGRDRLAFQAYEGLFDPVVQPTHLPVRNRVILKMQATWWLLDHLTRYTSGVPVRSLLSSRWARNAERQRDLAERTLEGIRGLMTESGILRLGSQLKWSLEVADEDVRSILWDHPRALMTSVLPTIVRRLEAVASNETLPDGFAWGDPMIDFVPGTLFAPLQTPEIQLVLPAPGQGRDPSTETEAVSPSLREFAPGRVSYRFALGGRRERMWVAPPDSHEHDLPIESFCPDYLALEPPPGGVPGRLIQPRVMRLTQPAGNVSDSAFGAWRWRTAFRFEGTPVPLDLPWGSAWASRVSSVSAMTHRHRCPLTVWRYATECEVERRVPAEPALTRHRVTLDGDEAGIGFAMEVDGLAVVVDLPTNLSQLEEAAGLGRALRVAYMEHLVDTSPHLAGVAPSPFLRSWLAQITQSALVIEAGEESLAGFAESSSDDRLRGAIVTAAREVFGAVDDAGTTGSIGAPDPGLVADISQVISEPGALAELRRAAAVLDGNLPAESLPWVQERYLVTIAAGLVDAIQTTCPDLDVDDLRPDFEFVDDEGDIRRGRIWISEDQPGGTGVIEAAVDRYVEDPRTFWSLVSNALGPCDGERVDLNLRGYLAANGQGTLSGLSADVRSAGNLGELTSAWSRLRERLFRVGLDADQTVVAALSTRLLRPGSDARLEELVGRLLDEWDATELRLGMEVDLRVFAYQAASDPDIRSLLFGLSGAQRETAVSPIGQIVGLLWTRGGRLRAASLQNYNPYCQLPATERLLFSDMGAERAVVDGGAADWREALDEALRFFGDATIRCAQDRAVSRTIHHLLTEPTAVGVLEFHPRVVGLTRSGEGFEVEVELREARQ